VLAFLAGIVVDSLLRTYGPPLPVRNDIPDQPAIAAALRYGPQVSAPPDAPATATARTDATAGAPSPATSKADAPAAAPTPSTPAPTTGATPLRLPIDGMNVDATKGGFVERRGVRPHEAVDILAPRDTPIHAVQSGTIAKLFVSKQGGNTIYQFDPGGTLCYYYAHLDHYAPDLREGAPVKRGDVIGYVGTTGNAPPNTPHLHFAVFVLDKNHEWWKGRAIDPYPLLKTAASG
jgi:murein DD-endopeptidase MepM/ murein hydrolase activator NlpD